MSKSRAEQKKNEKCGKRLVLSRQLRIKRIQSFVALRLRNCDYVVKKANRRLYALRQLKKCKVPSADIVHIHCSLIRSILEYASAVFAHLPKYLACYLEKCKKRPFPSFGMVFRIKLHLAKLHYPHFLTVGLSRVLNL